MTTAHCVVLTICALGIAPAMAAPPLPLGDPFHVRGGESVELAEGVKLKFSEVSDGRCATDVTCIWQGEAIVEIELQVKGETASGSVTTEHPDGILLAHGVKLLGLYPAPRLSEKRAAKEYVALLRVASTLPASAEPFADRVAALAAASRYVSAYTRSAKQVCADWQKRQLASYIEDSAALCQQFAKVRSTPHAGAEDERRWRFYFELDDPQMRTQMNETLYMYIVLPKAAKDAFDQVGETDIHVLPCDAVLLDRRGGGGCNAPPR